MGKFLKFYGSSIPTFCGIKFTSTLLDEGVEALNAHNKKFAVFLGADTLMLGAYAMGFDSAIATTLNIFPEKGIEILEEFKKNNLEGAKKAQDNLSYMVSIITKNGGWVPTMKAAMNLCSYINVGAVRKPLNNLTADQVNDMERELNQVL